MNEWIYTARDRFTPGHARGWDGYVEFSGFQHIEELISMDSMLCPDLIDEIEEADWAHNVQKDFRLTWFHDLEYLLRRMKWRPEEHQVLGILENPIERVSPPKGFMQVGFDIVDQYNGISTLTNCGQMPDIFVPADVNCYGLLNELSAAERICAKMHANHFDDGHLNNCSIWQVARMLPR